MVPGTSSFRIDPDASTTMTVCDPEHAASDISASSMALLASSIRQDVISCLPVSSVM